MVVVLIFLAFAVLALPVLVTLTAIGGARRGLHPIWSALAGLVFPITWAVWYVRDRQAASVRGARPSSNSRCQGLMGRGQVYARSTRATRTR